MPVELELDVQGLEETIAKLSSLEEKFDVLVAEAIMDLKPLILERFKRMLPVRTGKLRSTAKVTRRGNVVEVSAQGYYHGQGRKVLRKVNAETLITDAELAAAVSRRVNKTMSSTAPVATAKPTFDR